MKSSGELELKFNSGVPAVRKEVTRLDLAGTPYYAKDKVIFAIGTNVRSYHKNGKELFTFNTNMTETIKNVAMEENLVWISGVTPYG